MCDVWVKLPLFEIGKKWVKATESCRKSYLYWESIAVRKKLCRIRLSIYFLVVVAEQWSIISDNIFATFYIEQSDLVSCCGDSFATKPCKIVFNLSLREGIFARRDLWGKGANGKWLLKLGSTIFYQFFIFLPNDSPS